MNVTEQVPSKKLAERLRALDFGVRMPPSVIEEAAEFLEGLSHEPQPAASKDKRPLIEWARDRFERCVRLAKAEEPADRDEAFTDATYFRELLVILERPTPEPLPDYRAAMKAAECDEGIDCNTFIRVLQKKIADQQRELARLQRPAQPPGADLGKLLQDCESLLTMHDRSKAWDDERKALLIRLREVPRG